ncbi:MAG TPA: alpha/beta hydrolase fold domain-containing protein, partial [Candidatus Hydrogenedentes bacterium]|nr:alpha/beta hydrolase fold domain-containing protein [Candidatus Hydrogenedentota bacterium]
VPDFHEGSSDTPVWSADGRSVWYTARVGESVELFRTTLDGTAEQVTTRPAGTLHYHPTPAQDGRWLAYGSKRNGVRQLFVRDLAAGKETRVTDLTAGHAAMWPHWRPGSAAEEVVAPQRAPTHANIPYGPHGRQVLDFYQAASEGPAPMVLHIHGGGWVNGEKTHVPDLEAYLAAGISMVSINYRYSWQAQLAGVQPPVAGPLEDAARALQFVRSRAGEWNLDKRRIGATGTSAGACSSLYLALHDDLADPDSADPVARESTRLRCAAVDRAQTSLDPAQLREWTPNSRYGGHAFGFMDPRDLTTRDTRFAEFLARREEVLPWIRSYSPYELVSPDDPPLYLSYREAPALGQHQKDPTHTSNYGVKFQERCRGAGVSCEFFYPGAPGARHGSCAEFLIGTLKN